MTPELQACTLNLRALAGTSQMPAVLCMAADALDAAEKRICELESADFRVNAVAAVVSAEKWEATLRKENERLRAIVDRLPKTQAGEPIVPGDRLWVTGPSPEHIWLEQNEHSVEQVVVRGIGDDDVLICDAFNDEWEVMPGKLFGTREAAEAAREKLCK